MANYPWPSTVNFANYVSVKPWIKDKERSIDYGIWKEQMLCLLESQGLLGFIDGQILPPSPLEESMEEQKLWRRTDRLVKGWILGSVGKDVLAKVAGLNSSREVWLELENTFNHIRDDNEIQIHISESFLVGAREGEGEGEGEEGEAAAATGGGEGIQNVMVEGEDGIVELDPQTSNNASRQNKSVGKDYKKYLPLCRAILKGDWKEVEKLLDKYKEARTGIINDFKETALHVAVEGGKKSNAFLTKLLGFLPDDALEKKNSAGNTALHLAATIGNKEAAIMLVKKNAKVLYILNNDNRLPVHEAVISCHKETLLWLISISEKDVENSPFTGLLGASLLRQTIASKFIHVALYLVQNYPDLATVKDVDGYSALEEIACSASVFHSAQYFASWWKWIYDNISVKPTKKNNDDIGNLTSDYGVTRKYNWVQIIYPGFTVKSLMDKKVMHIQALELVKCLCRILESLPSSDASPVYERAIIKAANNGIHEVVEVIIEIFPHAIYTKEPETGGNIFHLAIRNRFKNVFVLLYGIKERKHFFYDSTDFSGNNYMHMCGDPAPRHKLNLPFGAALQMQCELQWFKEMEKFVNPSRRTGVNGAGKTPQMLFTEKHQDLKSQGEKWMKDTAASCTIVAALIAAVAFAAAFTVPGGFDSNTGRSVFSNQVSFRLFAISDTLSLFTSTAALVMFLSIFSSRYAEEDFLLVLPRKLSLGLFTLLSSIILMMVTFSAAIYITLLNRISLFLLPLVSIAYFPVLFIFLQLSLLIELIYMTYGPGIFGKKSYCRLFY